VTPCSYAATPSACARPPLRRRLWRLLALGLLATTLPLGPLARTAQPAAAATVAVPRPAHRAPARPGASVAAHLSVSRAQMLALINAERAEAGRRPLHLDLTLTRIAQHRSQDMIARHYFSHHIPGGGMVFDILDRDHIQYEMAGENIALNNYINFYPMAQTVRQTNADFMNSPEHRANLLEPKYAEIGLGMAFERRSGKLVVTDVFVQP